MLKTIALTMGILGIIACGVPVFAQAPEQPQQAISQEEVYWIMKSCEWLKAGHAPWDIEQYLTSVFLKQLLSTSSSSALVNDITRQINDVFYNAAKLKARIAVTRASSLLDLQGQCW